MFVCVCMTWNMLVTQAAYSFAQAQGGRIGEISPLVQPYQQSQGEALLLAVSQRAIQWVAGQAPRSGWELLLRCQRLAGQLLHNLLLLLCILQHACNKIGAQPSLWLCCAPSNASLYQSWWSSLEHSSPPRECVLVE